MATVDRWLLPDGIEEVLPPQAAQIEASRRQVLDMFGAWGNRASTERRGGKGETGDQAAGYYDGRMRHLRR